MKRTLVVPIDFTPVSHEALLYACELSVNRQMEIVAVHVLDNKSISEFQQDEDSEVRKIAQQMQQEMLQKTKADLDNFLEGLSVFYGDIIHPLIAYGTIYDAFNEVAAKYNAPLIVMGTHGIVGMQHIFGSKAYKVISHSPYPFLVVQARSFNTLNKVLLTLKNADQLESYASDISNFAGVFGGQFHVNILTAPVAVTLPEMLKPLEDRFLFTFDTFGDSSIMEYAVAHAADAIGMVVDDADNASAETYGVTQDKVLVNTAKLPVLCLPHRQG